MIRIVHALLFGVVFVSTAFAESASSINTTPAKLRFSYEEVTIPANEKMGLLGGTFLYEFSDHLSAGPAAYGAITGNRGGFITLGLATEARYEFNDWFEANAGFFVGAGGGRGGFQLQGGGLMLRSHVGALIKSEWGNVGGGISYVDFPNGSIHSRQSYIVYEYPFHALIADGWPNISSSGGRLSTHEDSESEFSVVYRTYRVPAGVKTDAGRSQYPTINLLGVEWRRYLNRNVFAKIESEGAMGGKSKGYMQILLGGGYRYKIGDWTAVIATVSLGVAGGGSVATGGGLLIDSSLALQQHLSERLYVELGGGYVRAPDGDFRAASINASLGYHYRMPETSGNSVDYSELSEFQQHPMRMRLVHQTYKQNDPRWRSHHSNLDVSLLGFQGDYFVSDRFYLSGQGIGAYNGQAGGYMIGLIGGGAHVSLFDSPLFAELELLGGAAGGGGLDVGGGLVWQGNLGIGYQFDAPYSVQASYGRIEALKGNFKAHVYSLSLAYHFSFFAR